MGLVSKPCHLFYSLYYCKEYVLTFDETVGWYHHTPVMVGDKVLAGVAFIGGSMFCDWILGACLIYDLVALAVGQSGWWRIILVIYASVSAVIVAIKNISRSISSKILHNLRVLKLN